MNENTIDGRHFSHGAHVEVLPGVAGMRGEVADQVRPALRGTRRRQSERQPALDEENAVELPPAYQKVGGAVHVIRILAAAAEGQFVDAAEHKAIADILIGETAF